MDLSAFDEPEVRAALARVATDPAESELVAASAGESLAELWIARALQLHQPHRLREIAD